MLDELHILTMVQKTHGDVCLMVFNTRDHFQQYFSHSVAVSFIGGGPAEKTTDLSQVTDKFYHIMLHTSRFELTTSVVIDTA